MPGVHAARWLGAVVLTLGLATTAVATAGSASAHDSTNESITLTVTDRRVLGTAPVLFTELGYEDTSGDGLIDTDELEAQEATVARGLVEAVREHVRLELDGHEAEVIGAGPAPVEDHDPSPYVQVLFATGPHDGDVSDVGVAWSFTSPSAEVLVSGPDEAVTARLDEDGAAHISLAALATASSFFASGLDHVRLGPDHLLFLVVLTIAVVGTTVSRSSTWRVVRLVTAFTVGHATSLCLAYFEVVTVPARWVEPAISLSIVAAAVLAVRGRGDGIRPWIATVVGLVHGLGFAGSLGSMGLATADHAAALAAFNVGVDVAQTAVVLLVTGAIWLSGRLLPGRQAQLRTAVCVGAGLMGLGWTATRLAA